MRDLFQAGAELGSQSPAAGDRNCPDCWLEPRLFLTQEQQVGLESWGPDVGSGGRW